MAFELIRHLSLRNRYNFSAVIGGGGKWNFKRGYIMVDLRYHLGFINVVNEDNRNSNPLKDAKFGFKDEYYFIRFFNIKYRRSGNLYDYNKSTLPAGGQFISLGSTGGFGYQPLVSAGGTANVSIAGTISTISIGNSGSGYRSGVQIVKVGVAPPINISA